MEQNNHRRFVLTPSDELQLPVIVESVGHNPNQEKIVRSRGYPLFHWIQTGEGEGTIAFEGRTYCLPRNSGVLLFPHVAHTYEAASGVWSSLYLTFGGPAVEGILASVGINASAYYLWETKTPLSGLLEEMLSRLESEHDLFGLNVSADAYRFLITLSRYGQLHRNTANVDNLKKIRTLIEWMEENYSDSNIGLEDIASVLRVSNRHLNGMFQKTFGLSSYAYFINFRIRKAKEKLVSMPDISVKEISEQVGFRDVSHFVATFRRNVGIPPGQFRKLY